MSYAAYALPTRVRAGVLLVGLERRLGLGCALAASVLAHMLVLSWPLPLPRGGEPGAARPQVATLQVTLNLIAEAQAKPERKDSPPAAPVEPPKNRNPPAVAQGVPDAVQVLGYYPAGRLSRMPVAVSVFDILPPAGGDTGLGGKMTVRIWIGVQGGVDSARILSSELPADYQAAALTAFEKMRFKPGEFDGVPVGSWADIVIQYADFKR